MIVEPAGTGTPLDGHQGAGQAEVALDLAFHPQRLLQESRDAAAVRAQQSADVAALTSLVVVSRPAENRNVASRTTSITSGVDPSGYLAPVNSVSTSPRGSRRRSTM